MDEPIPSLPTIYPQGIPVATKSEQKPLMKLMGQMMARRLKLPHPKVISQSVKLKHKKVKYW